MKFVECRAHQASETKSLICAFGLSSEWLGIEELTILLLIVAAVLTVRSLDKLADTRRRRVTEGESMKPQINRIV